MGLAGRVTCVARRRAERLVVLCLGRPGPGLGRSRQGWQPRARQARRRRRRMAGRRRERRDARTKPPAWEGRTGDVVAGVVAAPPRPSACMAFPGGPLDGAPFRSIPTDRPPASGPAVGSTNRRRRRPSRSQDARLLRHGGPCGLTAWPCQCSQGPLGSRAAIGWQMAASPQCRRPRPSPRRSPWHPQDPPRRGPDSPGGQGYQGPRRGQELAPEADHLPGRAQP